MSAQDALGGPGRGGAADGILSGHRLRVATYNIRHGRGSDDRLDLARTCAAIAELDADVIGLQEVDEAFSDRSDFVHQTAHFAAELGMEAVFGAAIDRDPAEGRETRRRYGLAVLSRHPILEHTTHALPGHPGHEPLKEPRAVLTVRIDLPGAGPLTVLITHLDHDRRAHRLAQILAIHGHAAAVEGDAILMGDMNADPDSTELSPLAATGWRDAAREAAGRQDRLSDRSWSAPLAAVRAALRMTPAPMAATYPARLPLTRIDSIWLRGDLRARQVRVGSTLASDHRPVIADLVRG